MAEDIGCYSLIMVGQQLLQMKIYDDSLPGGKTEWPPRLIIMYMYPRNPYYWYR